MDLNFLRKKAEKILQEGNWTDSIDYSKLDTDSLIEELKLQQIMLELKSSELEKAKDENAVLKKSKEEIVDQKLSEESLRRSLLLLEESQSIAKLGGWELDVTTGELYWTAETYRIHDTSPEEFNPTVDAGVGYFLPESKTAISKALEAAITQGEGYDLYLETYTTKGRLIDVRTTCVVTMENNKAVKLTGIFQDITEQRRTEKELELVFERLSLATNSAKIGVWDYTIDENLLIWDDQMLRLFGYTKESFNETFESWKKVVHPEDIKKAEHELNKAIEELTEFNSEYRVIWPDKSVRFIRAHGKVLQNTHGKVIRVVGVNYDITDVREREEELRQAMERAEGSDRLKTAFLSNMRHEIRTPMNAIVGFANQLKADSIEDNKRLEYASIVVNSSNQLLSIVNDIISISLLESKQESVNNTEFRINEILKDLLAIFRPQAENKNLVLRLSLVFADDQSYIYTDKSKLTQVLSNLLTNSLKFTNQGGIEFGYEVKYGKYRFFVKDTGVGIEDVQLEKIFERFWQAHGETSVMLGGTGLGLSISKGLVDLLGGSIEVESKVNVGTKFFINLPNKPIEHKEVIQTQPNKMKGDLIILIAEDQVVNFYFLEIVLKKTYDCTVLHAMDGAEAIEAFQTNPKINLILMDINMPIMNGFDSAKKLKELAPNLYIIAQTGYDVDSEKEKYGTSVFDDYLAKPIDEKKLASKISKVMANII